MNAADFLKLKNWVVIGDVLNDSKYAFKILKALKIYGLNVSGIHPKDQTGKLYKFLKDVPYSIDVIDLCINSKYGIEYIKEAKDLGINNILIQPGAESMEIIKFAGDNKMNALEGCALAALSSIEK